MLHTKFPLFSYLNDERIECQTFIIMLLNFMVVLMCKYVNDL